MTYKDDAKRQPTMYEIMSGFNKAQQDNVKVNRDYDQSMAKNLADIGTYQRKLMNDNMVIRRNAHAIRMQEALKMAEKETDDSKLGVYLDRINEARRGLSSIKDWRGGREFEGETPMMTMDELKNARNEHQALLAFGKKDDSPPLADKIGTGNVRLAEEVASTIPAKSRSWFDTPYDNFKLFDNNKSPNPYRQNVVEPFSAKGSSNPAELVENYLAYKSNVAGNEYVNANTRLKKLKAALKYIKYKTIEYGNEMYSPISHAQKTMDIGQATYDWFHKDISREK